MEEFSFESADGMSIQGWIVKPPDFDPARKYPLILSIHGGPHVMWSRHEADHVARVADAGGVWVCRPSV